MVNRLRGINLIDFTGGLNLHANSAQLAENEVPELLNMEPNPRGGLRSRRGWDGWNDTAIAAAVWNPRNAQMHVSSNGEAIVLLANDKKLWLGERRVFSQLGVGTIVVDAVPHEAEFVSWDDYVYIAAGWNRQAIRYQAITKAVVHLTASGGANWQNDYSAPGSGTNMPQAELIANHAGYMFVAGTKEAGVYYPNRVRWSHPNNPHAWAANDFWDISEGGGKITAIMPYSDRLLIFKRDQLWALFGYNAENWEMTNISRTVGAIHAQAVTRSEAACWFMSWPQGIFAYTDRDLSEVSQPIRPVFTDNQVTRAAIDNVWLGWVNRRLWVSLPWYPDGQATDVTSAFVFDFEVGRGAWMRFQGADGRAPGPYMERPIADEDIPILAFSRTDSYAIQLDARDDATDSITASGPIAFPTAMRTGWIDAGAPTHRKSWRRPDFLVAAQQIPTEIQVQVFHNFDAATPQRQFNVSFTPPNATPLWNQFVWNDGTVYRRGAPAIAVERGSTMGRAGAVQVRASTAPVTSLGKPWGFEGIIAKFIPRRFR